MEEEASWSCQQQMPNKINEKTKPIPLFDCHENSKLHQIPMNNVYTVLPASQVTR